MDYHQPNLIDHQETFCDLRSLEPTSLSKNSVYTGNRRLGFIYQHLCTQAFVNSAHYQVLAEEIQLSEQGRTLGAIDLIVRNKAKQRNEHWELAIKFYLLHEGQWFGPNAHDQLETKLPHMLNHQLAMSTNAQFHQQHPELEVATHHLLMQGRLYTNPFNSEPTPTHCLEYPLNSSQISGYWCHYSQAHQIQETLYELPKIRWATGKASDAAIITPNPERFIHAQTDSGQFWFVVPDVWPGA
ncbi:hypothetical protein JCM19238_4572 [Vibrio ponticus]|nr:hypothetical protein JCM19238_4572 [Vibrio ponticus]